jgi:hypothetical protein
VPAAAVIPAPIAYTKVVAVKKLVVEIVSCGVGLPIAVRQARLRGFSPVRVHRRRVAVVSSWVGGRRRGGPSRLFTLNKLECSKRAIICLNIVRME